MEIIGGNSKIVICNFSVTDGLKHNPFFGRKGVKGRFDYVLNTLPSSLATSRRPNL
jgi:hypothetical protein